MKTCLVTGATGAIGPRLLVALRDDGWRVRALARRSSRLEPAPWLEVVEGDVTDAAAVRQAVEGVDAVFHLAALLHVVDATGSLAAEYRRVNVDATRLVTEAATDSGIERLLYFSTIAVYGYGRDSALAEHHTCHPDSLYGRTKLEGEQIVLAARRPDGEPLGTVLRLAAVYGPGIKGNYERLVRAVARGRFIGIGPGENRRALVHDTDVARAALLAVRSRVAGRVFNISDGRPHRLRDIIEAIALAAGRRPPHAYLPVPVARGLATITERACRLARITPPVTRATIDKYVEDVVVDVSRMRQELGFESQVTLADGWRDTVEGLRARGAL